MMAASQEINGPPGKRESFVLCMSIVLMLAMQPDFGQACLVLFGWGVMYFVAGAPMLLLVVWPGWSLLRARSPIPIPNISPAALTGF